jgi:hypothetical protein
LLLSSRFIWRIYDLYFCKPGFLFYAAPDISSDFKEGESISGTAGSSATDVAGG